MNAALTAVKVFTNMIYPQRCYLCGVDIEAFSNEYLCPDHRRLIHLIEESFCSVCGKKLYTISGDEYRCARCREEKRWFERGYTVAIYEDSIRSLIHAFKYAIRI